jgi:hypothetical protein
VLVHVLDHVGALVDGTLPLESCGGVLVEFGLELILDGLKRIRAAT